MKILINGQEVCVYPKLMKSKQGNSIVLFSSETVGVCIAPDCTVDFGCTFGQYREDWLPEHFEDFDGEVTLCD